MGKIPYNKGIQEFYNGDLEMYKIQYQVWQSLQEIPEQKCEKIPK